MEDELVCVFCGGDPFEYVLVDDVKVPFAISCCGDAIRHYYRGLVSLSSGVGGDLIQSDVGPEM